MAAHPPNCPEKNDAIGLGRQPENSNTNKQVSTAKDESTKRQQNPVYHDLNRSWPTWRETAAGVVEQVKKDEQPTTNTNGMTPMERWSRETQDEGHWHGIQSFAFMPDQEQELEIKSAGGNQNGSTDDLNTYLV